MAIVTFRNYKTGQSKGCMGAVMRYVMQDTKTLWNDRKLISGVNCQPQMVYQDFLSTKRLYHKTDGKQFYHMVQSFPKGAQVDPVTAHAAALELAQYYKGYEVLVCTHVDREHIHSHFLINSVNCENGRKLHIAKDQIQELRQRNDAVCAQFSLPVFEKMNTPRKTRSITIGEYHLAAKGQSKKLQLMNVINDCMCHAANYEQFVALMVSEGYKVRWDNKRRSINYTSPTGWNCRDIKLFGDKYLKENMEYEFTIRAELIYGRTDGSQPSSAYASGAADGIGRTDTYTDAARASDTAHGDPLRSAGTYGASEHSDEKSGERTDMAEQVPASDLGALGGSHMDADGRTAKDTEASGNDGRTGWEAEREAYFASKAQTAQASPPQTGRSHGGDSSRDLAGSVTSVVAAVRRLEQAQRPAPVNDATGHRYHVDSKTLKKLKQKKIALGHKEDDHEDEQIWQQTM